MPFTLPAPGFACDAPEHACYLKYPNRQTDCIGAFYNVTDWREVGLRYAAARASV